MLSDLKAKVFLLTPQVGDTIVITTPWPMHKEQVKELETETLERLPEGVKVLVLHNGMTMMHIANPRPPAEPAP